MFPNPLSALQKENFVVNPVSNSAISLCASSTELTYPKLSACLPLSKGSHFNILAVLFLFVPQESWDLQLWMFGYITRGFPRIFGYVLQVVKYSTSVPLDRGGFGGWNLMLTYATYVPLHLCPLIADMSSDVMWYSGQSYPAIYRATRGLGLVKRLRCSYVFKQKYSFKGVGISGKFDQYFPVTDLRKTCFSHDHCEPDHWPLILPPWSSIVR